MTLGEKIQALRIQQGLSQEGLAERLGVSRQAISKWELDKTVPEVKFIVELSSLFQVTTDCLLKEQEVSPAISPAAAETPPVPPGSREPTRVKAACVLLGCGNIVLLMLLLFSICKEAFWHDASRYPPAAVLLLAPVLIAVSYGLLWEGPLSPGVERRFRRGVGAAVILMGFSCTMFFGFSELVDDLFIDQVEGLMSLPLFFGLLAILMLLFWIPGCIIAHFLIKSLHKG